MRKEVVAMLTRRALLKLGLVAVVVPRSGYALAESHTTGTSFGAWRRHFEAGVARRMAQAQVPGVAVAIIDRDAATPYAAAFGFADVARGRRLTPDTPMHLASVSKLFTATSLVQLFQRRGLDLHDDVNRFLDFEVRNPHHPDVPITPLELITHTSSISDEGHVGALSEGNGDPTLSLSSFLKSYLVPGGRLYSEKRSFWGASPGTRWSYSNVAVALAGYVIQSVSGQGFAAYTQSHLFEPLEIENAHWYLDQFAPGVIATPYRYAHGRFIPYPQEGYPDVPAGMLRCSVNDLATAVRAMLGGRVGNPRVLPRPEVAEMLRDQVQRSVYRYQGLGWTNEPIYGRPAVGHSGSDRGAANIVILSKDKRRAVAVLTNTDATDRCWALRQSLVTDLLDGARLAG
jgi:CubicO group peptidase (beta-lactamase class C family)